MMDKLTKARNTISEADRKIAALFEERMKAVKLVAEYKKENSLPVTDLSREAELIADCSQYVGDDEIRKLYLPFIKNTISISKSYQHKLMKESADNCKVLTVFEGNSEKEYDIIIGSGIICKAAQLFGISGKVLVVTDDGVPAEYSKIVAGQFENSFILTFPQGESNKNFDTYKDICQKLTELSFTRKDTVIAVGGGVVGDLAGFAAATYMRGIHFYNIPTTLLAQVDASIGGKTAIDFCGMKNMIGAFYQPEGVVIDTDVLSTLDERHIRNGIAESIKMGITFSEELFGIFRKPDYMSCLGRITELSLLIKKAVVEKDEKEDGLRKSLNFGHTIGHAIESVSDGELLHGECVALGMLPMCAENIREEVLSVMKNIGFDTEIRFDKSRMAEILSHDKKSTGEKICVVKCNEIGSFIFDELSAEEITNLI